MILNAYDVPAGDKQNHVHGPSDFGTFGRYPERRVDEMPPEVPSASELTMRLRGLVPGPHKIWLANPELTKAIVPTGLYFRTGSSLTKGGDRDRHWPLAVCLHQLRAREDRRAAGRPRPGHSSGTRRRIADPVRHPPREQVVHELALTLAQPRVVPVGLDRRAKDTIGDAGIVDVTVLMCWFTGVSLT